MNLKTRLFIEGAIHDVQGLQKESAILEWMIEMVGAVKDSDHMMKRSLVQRQREVNMKIQGGNSVIRKALDELEGYAKKAVAHEAIEAMKKRHTQQKG